MSGKDKKNGRKYNKYLPSVHMPSFSRSKDSPKDADSKQSSGKDKPTGAGKYGQGSKSTGSQYDTTSGASSSSVTHKSKQTPRDDTREDSHGHPDGPAHVRPTVTSAELKIDVKRKRTSGSSSSAGSVPSSSSQTIDNIFDPGHEGVYKDKEKDRDHYKSEYRRLKSENDDLKTKLETEIMTIKADLEAKNTKVIELSAAIEVKDVEISNLTESLANKTSEVREQEENFKQALVKNQEWEGDYTKLKDSVAKLKEKVKSKYNDLLVNYNQLKEEKEKQALLHSEEVAKREGAEQQLAKAKSDLAELQAKHDEGFQIVHTENEEVDKKIQSLEETISEKTAKLNEMENELKTVQIKHQQRVKQLEDDMNEQALQNEAKLKESNKTIESLKTTSTQSVNWSSMKIQEKDHLIKQMEDDKRDLSTQLDEAKKETENIRKTLEEEHQQAVEQLNAKAKENEQLTKQMKDNKKNFTAQLEALKTESDNMKQTLEREHQQTMEQSIAQTKEIDDKIQQLKDENVMLNSQLEAMGKDNTSREEELQQTIQQLDSKAAEKDEKIKQLEGALRQQKIKMEKTAEETKETKQTLDQNKENLQSPNTEDKSDAKQLEEKLREREEQIKQMEATLKEMTAKHEETAQQMNTGNKEREDRIAELEEFINDQVTELDKMEAALKQTVANKETLEKDLKELNEAMNRKHSQADSIQSICDEKDDKIKHLEAGVQKILQEKGEMSEIIAQTQEELTTTKQQLTSCQGTVGKLSDIKAKQEKGISPSHDVSTLQQTVKRLTTENAELHKQMESLNRRNASFRESTNSLRIMLQKQEGKEVLTELATKNVEIDNLNKQIMALQNQVSELQSTTAKESEVVQHVSNTEYQSSVEYQHQDSGHSSSVFHLEEKLKTMESELQSAKNTMEEKERKYKEKIQSFKDKVQRLEHQKATSQAADAAENTGSEAIQSLQAEKKQLTQKYQSLKQKLDQSNKGYQGLEEKSKTMEQDNKELLIQLNAERAKVREVKQRSRHVDDLENLLQEKQREIVQLAQERDSARTKIVEIQKQGSSSTSAENDAKAVQDYQNMKLQHDSVAIQLKQKERELQAKEVDAADLREQVNNLEKQLHSITERNIQKQHSYGTAHSKQSEVLQGQPLITVPPEKMTVMLAQKEQTISSLQEQVKQLQEQLSSLQSSSNPEVGSPTMEHVSGEEVGASDSDGKLRSQIDGSGTSEIVKDQLLKQMNDDKRDLTTQLKMKETEYTQQAHEQNYQQQLNSQVITLEAKVKELRDELATEQKATEAATSQLDETVGKLQQLRNEKRILDQQMTTGNKEREDRIAELEEFINDQVTELDKMEAALKQTVASKEKVEEDYKNLDVYYKSAKKLVETYEQRHIDHEATINQLEGEKEALVQSNSKLSREVARLMDVDTKFTTSSKQYKLLLQKAEEKIEEQKVEIRKAEEELQTKEFLINTYKEDFEQERKDRENAHNIKEDEIKKVRIEMQEFEAQCQGKVQNVKRSLEDQVAKYKEQATHYSAECNKISKEYEKLHREYNAEFTKLSKERDRMQAELEKEKKEAQGKLDVYKRKTEQFQVQWRKREESEAQVKMITEQLNHQIELNKQQQTTINDLMRKYKNIEPQIPTNTGGHQAYEYQQQSQQHRHDTLSARTNAEAPYQHPSPPPSQQGYQGQGRGGMPQNIARPAQPGYQKKYLPPSNFDNQPQSMREYNTAGTNAAMQQDRYYVDEPHREHYGQGRHNTGPVSLDSYKARQIAAGYNNANFPQQPQPPSVRSERPPHGQAEHYVSEGINEEIRHQADFQRQQNQQDLEFTSHLALDPFLICPNCKRQFREGQLPEYRRHIDNCHL